MARREVVEITCDRCKKVETQATNARPKGDGPEFSGTLHGDAVKFEDMCKRCRDAVASYWNRIIKKAPDESSVTVEENNEAAKVEAKEETKDQEPAKKAVGIFRR